MADEYTPTTEMVKTRYAIGHGGLSDDQEDVRASAFDRWYAAEIARAKAEARAEVYEEVFDLIGDQGCWGDYIGPGGSREYGFGIRPIGSGGPTIGLLEHLHARAAVERIEAGQ